MALAFIGPAFQCTSLVKTFKAKEEKDGHCPDEIKKEPIRVCAVDFVCINQVDVA